MQYALPKDRRKAWFVFNKMNGNVWWFDSRTEARNFKNRHFEQTLTKPVRFVNLQGENLDHE